MRHGKVIILASSIITALLITTAASLTISMWSSTNKSHWLYKGKALTYEFIAVNKLRTPLSKYIFNKSLINALSKVGLRDLSNVKFILRMYSNYSSYLEFKKLLAQGKSISKSTYYLLDSESCTILAKDVQLVIKVLSIYNDKARIKASLEFFDGVAVCGNKFIPRPFTDTSWIKKGRYFYSKFHRLVIYRSAYIDLLNGLTYIKNTPTTEWFFWLSRCDMRGNDSLMLYSISTTPLINYKNRSLGLANLLYIVHSRELGTYIVKGISASERLSIKPINGFLLIELKYSGISMNELRRYLPSIKINNLPPFIKPMRYISNNLTLIRWLVLLNKIPIKKCKPWIKVKELLRYRCKINIGNKSIINERILYGIKYHNQEYLAGINLNIINATYLGNGLLKRAVLKVNKGFIAYSLPTSIIRLFGIADESLVDAAEVAIQFRG